MKTDICLISPAGRANEPRLPLGLMYIAACLEREGIKTDIIDIKISPYQRVSENIKQKIETDILRNIEEKQPLMVGITCLVTEGKEVLGLCQTIKHRFNNLKTIVGGIHPTMYPQDFLYEGSPVDYVVIGEGEYATGDLAKTIKGEGNDEDVLGIAKFNDKEIYKTPPRPVIEHLDDLPFPAYEKVDMDYYTRPSIYAIRTMLLSTAHIFTSRGCPYQCTFCVNKNLAKIMGSRNLVRSRSVKNVVDEIEYLAQHYKIDGFYIWDDTFAINRKYVIEFCQELSMRNLRLIWAAETRVNLVSEEMINAMRNAGCVQLDFGVESGSQEILNRINKGIKIDQIKTTFDICHQLDVRTYANLMFNTLDETERDVQETFYLAKEIDADGYNFSICTPFPGTDLYNRIEPKLTISEYPLFLEAIRKLTDPRFKLAQHNLNLGDLIKSADHSFDSLRNRISFLFDKRYIRSILKSSRKREYILTILSLIILLGKRMLGKLVFKVYNLQIIGKKYEKSNRANK